MTKKSTTIAFALVAAALLVLAVVWLLRESGRQSPTAQPSATPPTPRPRAAVARPEQAPAPAPASADAARQSFAIDLDRRFRKRGRTVRVRARGEQSAVLEFHWLLREDRDHIDQLKQAKALHDELRALGFKQLTLRVANEVRWSNDL